MWVKQGLSRFKGYIYTTAIKTRTATQSASTFSAHDVKTAYWDEQIRHLTLVLLPCLSVFSLAFLDISIGPVAYHEGKKEWIEPRQRAVEACDQCPREGEIHVRGVMNFACIPVFAGQRLFRSNIQGHGDLHHPSARIDSPA